MKKVLTLFGRKSWEGPVFSLSETQTYQRCYEFLYAMAEKEGVQMFRASSAWYDKKNKVFTNAWTFENNEWKRVFNIKPDLIYDKTKLTPENQFFKQKLSNDFPIINDLDFTLLLDNKLFTSMLLPEFSKKHYLIKNNEDLNNVLEKIRGEMIVLKKNTGSGGKDVFIVKKDGAKNVPIDSDFTAQEFIDSSHGITGLTDGAHDLRLVFINNELIYSYIRIPKEGSLLANLSQGGTMLTVKNENLPESLNPIIKKVQETFDCFEPKIYTIDLMFDEKQTPWVIELNSMPGLYFSPDQEEEMKYMYSSLVKVFKEYGNNRNKHR